MSVFAVVVESVGAVPDGQTTVAGQVIVLVLEDWRIKNVIDCPAVAPENDTVVEDERLR